MDQIALETHPKNFSGRDNNILVEMENYHFSNEGKKIRSTLIEHEAKSIGISHEEYFPWMNAIEIMHNSTLVHDDIQDRDELRRGRDSVWKKYGVPQAINLGNALIFKSFLELDLIKDSQKKEKLYKLLSQVSYNIVLGQALEFDIVNKSIESFWSEYIRFSSLKTSELLKGAIQGIYIIKGTTINIEALLSAELIYQIEDDIKDWMGLKQPGQIKKDFEETKVNSLVAWLSRDLNNYDVIFEYLNHKNKSVILEYILKNKVLDHLMKYRESLMSDLVKSNIHCKEILINNSKKFDDLILRSKNE